MADAMSRRVVVIGGGLGGLSAACTLAARGHQVTVLERNAWWGGKAAVHEAEGFRFDMGPTIVTLPSVLRRVFAEAGHQLEDRLSLVRLDPQWRCFFDDGAILDLHQDEAAMATALDRHAPASGDGAGYRRFMALSRRLHGVSDRFFFYRPVGSLRDVFRARDSLSPRVLADVASMRMWSTVAATIRAFVADPRAAQMLDHYTQYVGSSPERSPAVLCGIAHMQAEEGVWHPRGGTAAVPAALVALATELGVELRAGQQVRRVVVGQGRVSAVETSDGDRLACDAVVSNMDSLRTYRELIGGPAATAFESGRRFEPACSGVVLYLGLRRGYEHLLHHNFVFSRDPHEEFEAIYERGEPAPDPTCYVCAPARTEREVAPPGGEALYVLVHTPHRRPHHDWRALLPRYREVILRKLESTGRLEGLASRIQTERILTPEDIHDRYQVLEGAIYGLASHGRLHGAFKPGNRSRQVRGLYLAGGAAHPGPGMPMVVMSGWIAADALDRDARAGALD